MTLLFTILKKRFVQKLQHIRLPSLCAYPQYKYAYVHNYSAHGHELSGCIRADAGAYNLILISASYYYAPWPWPWSCMCMIRERYVILKAALLYMLAV